MVLPRYKRGFFIPENLDLPTLLREHGYVYFTKDIHLDKFYYLIDRIYLDRHIRDGSDEDVYVPINAKVLESIVGKPFATRVKRTLVALKILEEDPRYRRGRYSMGYRFGPAYRNSTFRLGPLRNQKLLNRISRNRDKIKNEVAGGHEGRILIARSLEGLEFDCEAATDFVSRQHYQKKGGQQRRFAVIELFRSDCHTFSCDAAGRLYHALTTCSRDLRQFVAWRGKPLFAADVSNSQPALHSLLYKAHCAEKERFIELVSANRFYAFINSKLAQPVDLEDEDQKTALKRDIFHRIFYGWPHQVPRSEAARVFAEHFPHLDDEIKSVKWDGIYDRQQLTYLPVMLQKVEADLVINRVATDLSRVHAGEEFCLISIHDCLVTTEENIEEVKSMLCAAFQEKLGFLLPVKVRRITREAVSATKQPQDLSVSVAA